MNSDAFYLLQQQGIKYLELFKQFNIKKEADFHSNNNAIHFVVHVIFEMAQIAKTTPIEVYHIVYGLRDIIEPLINYSENLTSKFSTHNTYKLYDFMILDLPKMIDLLKFIKNS